MSSLAPPKRGVLRSARRDAFLHQLLDPLDQEFLFRRLGPKSTVFTLI